MKPLLALTLLLVLASCIPKAIIVEPVTPHAVRARAEVKAAADSSKRVKKSVETVHTQAKGIAAEVNRATDEVSRLKIQPGVTLDDFDALWLMMTDLQTSTWAHEIKTGETVAATVEQEHLQATAGKTLEALETTAIAHDKGVEGLKTQLGKAEKNAAIGGYLRGWIVVAAVSLGLLVVGWIFLKVCRPPFLL